MTLEEYKQEIEENEQEIYDKLNKNRLDLYSILKTKINMNTNNYFYLNEEEVFSTISYSPTLDSSLKVIKWFNNSNAFVNQGNGVVSLKGAVLQDGWSNKDLWEMSVDIRYDKIAYTGLILLADAENPFRVTSSSASPSNNGWGIRGWEGTVTGTPRLADGSLGTYTKTPDTTLSDGTSSTTNTSWYTLHMKKTSLTTLEVWKNNDTENKVVYEWEELSDVDTVTFGANTNPASSSVNGSIFIRNLTITVNVPDAPYTITELCQDTELIKSNTYNVATVPTKPKKITSNKIGLKEINIHNKIQYCNNILRYVLRVNDIDFNNSNKMHELIEFIDDIEYNFVYTDRAVQNLSINNDGNLIVDWYEGDINNATLVTDISLNNEGNLSVTKELIDSSNINDVIYNLKIKDNGTLTYDNIGDISE